MSSVLSISSVLQELEILSKTLVPLASIAPWVQVFLWLVLLVNTALVRELKHKSLSVPKAATAPCALLVLSDVSLVPSAELVQPLSSHPP